MRHWPTYLLYLLTIAASACTAPATQPAGTSTPGLSPEPAASPTPTAAFASDVPPSPDPAETGNPGTPDLAPQLANWHELVFHDRIGRLVLLNGGPETGKPADDPLELWAWDGARWIPLSAGPDAPPWRNFAAVAYDTARQVLMLYGGLQSEDLQFTDVWEWDGETWTRTTAPGPVPREGASMAYDAARGATVLFGGSSDGRMMGDTWLWDGQRWEQAASTGPAPRDGARLAIDPQTGMLLLFGGVVIDPAVQYFTETWLWNGAAWQEAGVPGPPGRVHPAMAYDALRGRIVLAGGSNAPGAVLPDVWEWDGEAWSCVFQCE
jgi:hypothetical protein